LKVDKIVHLFMLLSEQSRLVSLRVRLYIDMNPRSLFEGWKRPVMLLQFINWISFSLLYCPLISLAERRRREYKAVICVFILVQVN